MPSRPTAAATSSSPTAQPRSSRSGVAVLRLFAAAREAAGTGRDVLDGATVGDVLDGACVRYGEPFAAVLANSRVWVNGEPAARVQPVTDDDEVAVLPPVSGGTW